MDEGLSASLTAHELASVLVAGAAGPWEQEAATGLVTEHGAWLERGDFRRYVHAETAADGLVIAGIAWGDVGRDLKAGLLTGDPEDLLVLKVAVSLVGYFDIPLWEIENVHARTMRAIMRAIAVSAGYGEDVDSWCPVDLPGAGGPQLEKVWLVSEDAPALRLGTLVTTGAEPEPTSAVRRVHDLLLQGGTTPGPVVLLDDGLAARILAAFTPRAGDDWRAKPVWSGHLTCFLDKHRGARIGVDGRSSNVR